MIHSYHSTVNDYQTTNPNPNGIYCLSNMEIWKYCRELIASELQCLLLDYSKSGVFPSYLSMRFFSK
jgi:hypothetical protein